MLNKLKEAKLYLDINKYKFNYTFTKYLGYIIKTSKGIRTDLDNIKAIQE